MEKSDTKFTVLRYLPNHIDSDWNNWMLQIGKNYPKCLLNPLAYTAGCETGSAIDAFVVNSGFVSVDGMTCLIPFESWRNDLSNGVSYI
jgi:hypothetical protein